MPKSHALGYDELAAVLDYDPETGRIFWKIRASQRSRVGDEAGLVKNARKAGQPPKEYRYITYQGFSTTAARIAWLLTHREWPQKNILYVDGNTLNTKIENIKLGDFCSGPQGGNLRKTTMTIEAMRHYNLKRYYGLTMERYGQMLADQGGVCAICKLPEVRVTPKGDLTTLHVDHDHETNEVRALLCYRCNSALGSMRDDPALLREAANYLERHRTNRGT